MSILTRAFDPSRREIKRHERTVAAINALEEEFHALTDAQLAAKTAEFRAYLGVGAADQSHGQSATADLIGEDDAEKLAEAETYREQEAALNEILPEAFATVREMSRRVLGMRHYDVQLIGGMVLHESKIAEMRTGEGKTLVATLALYLNALLGKGAHLVTVNDYLARRDAGWNGPLYHALGLSVGVIANDMSLLYDPEYRDESHGDERLRHLRPVTRREAYAADITYATNNELGFDYLRDNMARTLEACVQRRLHYAIVDEVDSILIDEARTPLIISGQANEPMDKYYTYARLIPTLIPEEDYTVDEKSRSAALTEQGVAKVEKKVGISNIYDLENVADAHQVNKALLAHTLYLRDRDYLVRDGEVIIVDEFTGRPMEGRRWSDGLHQAIEAKEGVRVKPENITLATITFQNFFRLYRKLSGMTGTAITEAEEFDKIYGLEVVPIPTHRPMIRADEADLIFRSEDAKYKAVVEEIEERHAKGQPVLVGTTSIEKSERISRLLEKRGIEHNVLNAKLHEREAEIVANAGQFGAVTIATNMAGRGTDIVLGEGVKEAGGLYIMGTERHESRRIDNQLRGRAGRQGDPGETRFFLSFEDDLMRVFGGDRMQGIMDRFNFADEHYIESRIVSRQIEGAQSRVEGHNFDARRSVVQYDDVMNRQREIIYGERRKILEGTDTRGNLMHMLETVVRREVAEHCEGRSRTNWDMDGLWDRMRQLAPLPELETVNVEALGNSADEVAETLIGELTSLYEETEAKHPAELVRQVEQASMLAVIDEKWIDYLTQMTNLNDEVRLHNVGQLDPLVEYKTAAFEYFQALISDIETTLVRRMLLELPKQLDSIEEQARAHAQQGSGPQPVPAAAGAQAPPSPRADRPGAGRTDSLDAPPPARPAAAAASGALARATQARAQGGRTVTNVVESSGTAIRPAQGATATAVAGTGQRKVGRNEPCPCGSGRKFKHCHGA